MNGAFLVLTWVLSFIVIEFVNDVHRDVAIAIFGFSSGLIYRAMYSN